MRQKTGESAISGIRCLRHAHREFLEWWLIRVSLGILAASLLIFAVLGPLGIGEKLGFFQRLSFVAFCGVLCWPVCHALSAFTLHVARSLAPVQILFACIAGTLFAALPCTAVVLMAFGLFQLGDIDPSMSEAYVNTVAAALACRGVLYYVACQRAGVRLGAATESSPVAPQLAGAAAETPAALPGSAKDLRQALFGRLPEMLGRDIVFVTVSGHYVNVVTTKGSCLILMRLADAVAALGDTGIQVHRSYWVANRHIVGVRRLDGRMMLRLTGGREVPVSRTYRVAVDAAVSRAKDRRA